MLQPACRFSHVSVIRSGDERPCTPPSDNDHISQRASPRRPVAVARRDDENGTFESFSSMGSGTSASWFVAPIVLPLFLAVLVVIIVMYQFVDWP
jgi:hypothetical protein